MPVIWIFTISWDRYTIYLKNNFRIFLLALASGFQPPWSLQSICRKPTKSSSSRLLHLACSQGDFRHPIGEILVRHPERSPVTGCHRILENLETDHLQSQNRSVRSAEYPQNWLGNRGPQSDSPSWSWRRDLQLLALAKSSWSHSLAAAWRIPRSGNAMKFGHFAMISSPRLARTC